MPNPKDLIKELGEELLNFNNPFRSSWSLPIKSSDLSEAKESITPATIFDIEKIIEPSIKLRNYVWDNEISGIDDLSLALRVVNHDLIGITNILRLINDDFSKSINTPTFIKKLTEKRINKFYKFLLNYQSFGNTIAILGNSSDNYDQKISIPDIAMLLTETEKRMQVKNELSGTIQDGEYVILYQFVKNAPKGIKVIMRGNVDYKNLTVSDTGRGLYDKEGLPLPKDKIPEIFGDFSTKKGGLGLRLAKRLSELYGDYIEVKTTTARNPTLMYNTRDKIVYEATPHMRIGSEFSLHIPW